MTIDMNVITNIDYVSEAIALLTTLSSYKTFKDYAIDKVNNPKQAEKLFVARKNVFDFFSEIEEDFNNEFKADKEQLLYYFGPLKGDNHWDSIGRVILLWEEYSHVDTKSIDDFSKVLLEMDELEYYQMFCKKLQTFDDSLRVYEKSSNPETKEDVFREIFNSSFVEEDKLLFTELLVNHTKHVEKCIHFIRRAIKLIEKHESKVLDLYSWFIDYWEKVFNGEDPIHYFQSRNETLATLPSNHLGYVIIIEIFGPLRMGISMSVDDETFECNHPFIVPIGILFCDEYPLVFSFTHEKTIVSEEYYLSLLKQLSEKNRFDILSYIKDKEAFGNEIASYLGLSTATVSHHTGILNNFELVNIAQSGARIYFSSNKAAIRQCINFFRSKLL